jgi:hypothetical protein
MVSHVRSKSTKEPANVNSSRPRYQVMRAGMRGPTAALGVCCLLSLGLAQQPLPTPAQVAYMDRRVGALVTWAISESTGADGKGCVAHPSVRLGLGMQRWLHGTHKMETLQRFVRLLAWYSIWSNKPARPNVQVFRTKLIDTRFWCSMVHSLPGVIRCPPD